MCNTIKPGQEKAPGAAAVNIAKARHSSAKLSAVVLDSAPTPKSVSTKLRLFLDVLEGALGVRVRVPPAVSADVSADVAAAAASSDSGIGFASDLTSSSSSSDDDDEADSTTCHPFKPKQKAIDDDDLELDDDDEVERGNGPLKPVVQPTAYNKETEIGISRLFSIGSFTPVAHPHIPPHEPYTGPRVVTMTSFGALGRYGNQIFQYAFLLAYATRHDIPHIETPDWVGKTLFSLRDLPVQRHLPPAIEFRGTQANCTFTDALLTHVLNSDRPHTVPELMPSVLALADPPPPRGGKRDRPTPAASPPVNADIWGWFQWHTASLAPYREHIVNTLAAAPALRDNLERIFDAQVRFRGGMKRTVVALHLRLGDYKSISASSFGYVAPTEWYKRWLDEIWPTLHNPVLFVASDDVETVVRDFAAYEPLTGEGIGLNMPQEFKSLNAGFFPDWFALTQCDLAAISNSTFSLSATMMNLTKGARFFRAHYSGAMLQYDPWNCEPIIHRDMSKPMASKAMDTLRIVYNTQGVGALARNMLYELPYYGLRHIVLKAVLAFRQARNFNFRKIGLPTGGSKHTQTEQTHTANSKKSTWPACLAKFSFKWTRR